MSSDFHSCISMILVSSNVMYSLRHSPVANEAPYRCSALVTFFVPLIQGPHGEVLGSKDINACRGGEPVRKGILDGYQGSHDGCCHGR